MSSKTPLDFFKEITRYPRDTGDEKAVSDYLMDFAKQRGLRAVQDEAFNVVIYKPGTPGYESAPTVVLQGHLDMVYIKEDSCTHDYNSPLELIEEDGTLRANGTSLGADNGVGAAYAMALLDSTGLPHPPLEALFTTGEEVGMMGVETLSPGLISGRLLLNLDSEEEGCFCVGCAGGLRMSVSLRAGRTSVPAGSRALRLRVQGLLGGHSGIEIDKGRGNANRLLGRALYAISREIPLHVGTLGGGSKMNAIPDRAEALVLVAEQDLSKLNALAKSCQATFRTELSGSDPEATLTLEDTRYDGQVLTADSLDKVLLLLTAIPTGVQSMSMHLPGLVESSNNMGIVLCENEAVTIHCALRSSVGSLKEAISSQIELLAKVAGAEIERDNTYPEWPYELVSPLRDLCASVYREMYGKEPVLAAIHAGLECGYFKQMWPDMDIVSLGPDISGAHTPQETLDLASCQRIWDYIVRLMAAMKP